MDSRRPSNPLALAVLVLLFEKDMHPYEMAATMKERHKEGSIKLRYGSLYTVIAALEKDRLIAPLKTTRDGRRPERTVFRLTPAGLVRMRGWMHEILGTPVKEYPRFEAGLSLLPALPPHEAVTLLRGRAQLLDESVAELTRAYAENAGSVDRLFLIESDYHLALLKAEARFVKGLIADIERGAWPSLKTWKSVHAKPRGPGGIRWDS